MGITKLTVLLVIMLSFCLDSCTLQTINQKLSYFEILQSADIATRRKRSVDGSYMSHTEVNFYAFGRTFDLVLFPGSPVLASDFQAKTVDRLGRESPFDVKFNNFFTGHLAENQSVRVSGHFEDGMLSASIRFPSELYVVEPAWRHLPPSANCSMLVYRASDVIWTQSTPIEGTIDKRRMFPPKHRLGRMQKTSDPEQSFYRNIKHSHLKWRQKRTAVGKKICLVLVIVDYDFFKDVGGQNEKKTVDFVTETVNNVKERFKSTEWEDGLIGFGIQLNGIRIHTEYTDKEGHYNSNTNWKGSAHKLKSFMRDESKIEDQCLGHLFTSYSFKDGAVGLAGTANADRANPYGICGFKATDPLTSWEMHFNAGLTSGKDYRGDMLTKVHFELTCSHEFGHNFGAEHDSSADECSPSIYEGGRYLMWPVAVTGSAKNNFVFSPCSKRRVATVLKSKADVCFVQDTFGSVTSTPAPATTQPKTVFVGTPKPDSTVRPVNPAPATANPSPTDTMGSKFCGNALLEAGEECDAGLQEEGHDDLCCTSDCRLKSGAVCSDMNFGCCQNCQVASKGFLCAGELTSVCKKEAFCDGVGLHCPEAQAADDNTSCLDKGECHNGDCWSFCILLGKKRGVPLLPCVCDQNATAACRFCCMLDKPNALCEPTLEILVDGRTCDLGYCEKGVCKVLESDSAFRIFGIVTNVDSAGDFVRSNTVPLVVFLSLLFWVPASVFISRQDKRIRTELSLSAVEKSADIGKPSAFSPEAVILQPAAEKSASRLPGASNGVDHSIDVDSGGKDGSHVVDCSKKHSVDQDDDSDSDNDSTEEDRDDVEN